MWFLIEALWVAFGYYYVAMLAEFAPKKTSNSSSI
jgi:hypothetical protein